MRYEVTVNDIVHCRNSFYNRRKILLCSYQMLDPVASTIFWIKYNNNLHTIIQIYIWKNQLSRLIFYGHIILGKRISSEFHLTYQFFYGIWKNNKFWIVYRLLHLGRFTSYISYLTVIRNISASDDFVWKTTFDRQPSSLHLLKLLNRGRVISYWKILEDS